MHWVYKDAYSSLTVTLAQFTLSSTGTVETFDPAPPSLELDLHQQRYGLRHLHLQPRWTLELNYVAIPFGDPSWMAFPEGSGPFLSGPLPSPRRARLTLR